MLWWTKFLVGCHVIDVPTFPPLTEWYFREKAFVRDQDTYDVFSITYGGIDATIRVSHLMIEKERKVDFTLRTSARRLLYQEKKYLPVHTVKVGDRFFGHPEYWAWQRADEIAKMIWTRKKPPEFAPYAFLI